MLVVGLGHPHSRVRQALLSALDALMASGAVPQPLVEGIVVPGVRPLAADRSPAVREAFFAALAGWMGANISSGSGGTEASEADAGVSSAAEQGSSSAGRAGRCRLYAPLLLPLLLLGVSDVSEAVAAQALTQLEQVGDIWEAAGRVDSEQNGAEAAMEEGDGSQLAGASTQGEATAAAMQVDEETGSSGDADGAQGSKGSVSPEAAAAAALPPPYHGMPSAGTRAMGGALLPQLLPSLIRELREWTAALRHTAARCLHTLLVLAGPAATPHLARLVPALCAAVGDEDPEVAAMVAACRRVIGAFVPASHWLPLATDALADSKAGHAARANTLVVMAGLLHAAGRAGQQIDAGQLAAVAAALGGEEALASAAEHIGARAQLLAAVRALLAWAGPAAGAAKVSGPIYRALLQLHGSAQAEGPGGAAEVAAVEETLRQLQAATAAAAGQAGGDGASSGGGSGAALCALHGAPLLESLVAGASDWTPGSPALLAFGALLRTAAPACLAALLPRALDAMAPIVGNHDGDPGLRLALLRLVDELLEAEQSEEACRAPGVALDVITQLLMPPLAWRAGKVAAAVRFQAVTALATLVRRRLADEGALRGAVDAGLLPLLHQVSAGLGC